jgi:hypothetical protein
MRRFVTLLVLLLCSVPFGISISGCAKTAAPVYCNGGDSGITTGQITTIVLQPLVYGISLNYAEIGSFNTPSATDCHSASVSVTSYTWGTTDMTIADVQPTSGRVCAGTWNRNSGGGIPDYTYCTPTNKSGTAYIAASANGVTSNPVPVFVHPVVTGIVLGGPASGGAATITAWSIANTPPAQPIVTFTAQNSFSAGQVVSLSNFPASTFFNGIADAVVQAAGLSSAQFSVAIPGFSQPNGSATETGLATGPGCSADPSTDCCPLGINPVTAPPYLTNSCVSQGTTTQLVARVFAGTGAPFTGLTNVGSNVVTSVSSIAGLSVGQTVSTAAAPIFPSGTTITAIGTTPPYTLTLSASATATTTTPVNFNQTNISCQAGHLQFTAQGASSQTTISPIVSIDQNGVATANQPGSVLITANISNAASSAGFFSTCPPASITLSAPGTTTNPVVVNENNPQPLAAIAVDTNGKLLAGLSLEYVSTSPITIPANSPVTPALAGAASITAVCQPPSCNSSSYNQIGLFGNGKPVTSNSVNISTPGVNGTVLFMASTQSQYVVSRDFTQTDQTPPFLLPYVPNSMVISNDGSTIYMGSSTGLMVLSASTELTVSRVDITSPGTVLALSPDGTTLVLSDPVKQITTLETSSGGVITSYGGVGTHAEFTPDSQTVYITAGNQLLVYSGYTGWTSISPATPGGTPVTDVAVTVPGVGAYFGGPETTARGYCPSSTASTVGGVTTETNAFFPPADSALTAIDRIAATNDGLHILGASVSTATPPVTTLSDLHVEIPAGNTTGGPVSIACPTGTQTTNGSGVTTGVTGGLQFSNTKYSTPLSQITAGTITGVLPTSDSSLAFITYTLPAGSSGTLPALLPAYAPSPTGLGATTYIKLSGAATAPVAGVVSTDNTTFYAGTTGDNLVHIVNRGTLTDTSTLTPGLIAAPGQAVPAGTIVPVNLLVQKPRRTT